MYHDLNGRAALGNASGLQSLEVMLLLVLLEEHKDRQKMERELRSGLNG